MKASLGKKARGEPEKWMGRAGALWETPSGKPIRVARGTEVLMSLKRARGFSFSVQKREVRTTEDQGCDEQKRARASSSIFIFPICVGGRSLCPTWLTGNLRRMQKV